MWKELKRCFATLAAPSSHHVYLFSSFLFPQRVSVFSDLSLFWSLCVMVLARLCLMCSHMLSGNWGIFPPRTCCILLISGHYFTWLQPLLVGCTAMYTQHTCHPWHYLPLDLIGWSWNRGLCRDTLLCSAVGSLLHSMSLSSPGKQLTTVGSGCWTQGLPNVTVLRKHVTSHWYSQFHPSRLHWTILSPSCIITPQIFMKSHHGVLSSLLSKPNIPSSFNHPPPYQLL